VKDFKNLAIRKTIHAIMTLLLASPALVIPMLPDKLFLFQRPDPTWIYGLLMVAVAWVNALRVKGPAVSLSPEELEALLQKTPMGQRVDAAVRWLENLARQVEREYEKRAGWVGLMHGVLGVGISYFLFGSNFVWGVLALATTDVASALVGASLGRRRMPFASASTVEGTLAGFLVFLPIASLHWTPLQAVLLAAAAAFSEAYGVEDNLEVPFAVSLVAWLMTRLA